jgi:hypothetical protein
MILSMSCLQVDNVKKKENMIQPFVCNDGNNCYIADSLSNFASIITAGKEVVDLCLDSIGKLADNCTCLQDFPIFNLLEVELALPLVLFSLSGSLLTME